MTPDECCNILEVSINISLVELKKKYKRLVIKFHPDRNKAPNATQTFIKIKAAYEELAKYLLTPPSRVYPGQFITINQNDGFSTAGPGWAFTFTSS